MKSIVFKNGEHIQSAVKWWQDHHGIEMGSAGLSQYGILVTIDEKPAAITNLYRARDADIAWLGFTVVNKDFYFNKKLVLDFLHEAAEAELKSDGCKIVFTAYDKLSLQNIMAGRGYFKGSKTVEYWKELL